MLPCFSSHSHMPGFGFRKYPPSLVEQNTCQVGVKFKWIRIQFEHFIYTRVHRIYREFLYLACPKKVKIPTKEVKFLSWHTFDITFWWGYGQGHIQHFGQDQLKKTPCIRRATTCRGIPNFSLILVAFVLQSSTVILPRWIPDWLDMMTT